MLENAVFLQVLAGVDGIDDRQQAGCPFPQDVPDYPSLAKAGVEGLKIGLLREGFEMGTADPRVSALVEKAALELRKQGAVVEDVSIPFHVVGAELWMVRPLPVRAYPTSTDSVRRERSSAASADRLRCSEKPVDAGCTT